WEAVWTPTIILCTLATTSVASAWISRRKSIRRLLIFFSHWLRSGAKVGVGREDCTASTHDKQRCEWM
ncbi:unnamed protein product, partial [Ectocarpus fasciculatus]